MKRKFAIAIILSIICTNLAHGSTEEIKKTGTAKEFSNETKIATSSNAKDSIDYEIPDEWEDGIILNEDEWEDEKPLDENASKKIIEYEYTTEGGFATLTKYISDSNETIIKVPNEIDGYPVIGMDGTFEKNQKIEQVIIPEGIEFLRDKTFYECGRLKEVEFPQSLQEVGSDCFANSGIIEVSFLENVENIGSGAFAYCEDLEKVDLSETKITEIDYMFCNCSSLKEVRLPETLKAIRDGSFMYCTSLREIQLPDGIVEIGEFTFGLCKNLLKIILPDSLETMEGAAFYACDSLEELIIPRNVKNIETGRQPLVSGKNLKRIVNMSPNDYHKDLYDMKENRYFWYLSEESDEIAEYLPAYSTIYRRDNGGVGPSYDYCRKYIEKLQCIIQNGVSSKDANTEDEMRKYITSLAPQPIDENISFLVGIEITNGGFVPAIDGNYYNRNGTPGKCHVSIVVKDSNNATNTAHDDFYVTINPVPYNRVSSSGGGGGGGGSSSSKASTSQYSIGMSVSKQTLYNGTWENENGKWKLKLEDGSYASSQWANLNGDWYLLDEKGNMITGWKKANGKWYLLSKSGEMITGWQLVDGKWYWLEPSGEMVTGWKWVGEKCYYLDSSGAMLFNATTPDGYTVNENGEWVQ